MSRKSSDPREVWLKQYLKIQAEYDHKIHKVLIDASDDIDKQIIELDVFKNMANQGIAGSMWT